MIKRLCLFVIIGFVFRLSVFAQAQGQIGRDIALKMVETEFEGKDVDIYYINNDLSGTTWDFFIDAEPFSNDRVVARRASSKFSRGVERSETHGLLASHLVVSRQGIIKRAPR